MVTLNENNLKTWQDMDLEHIRYEYDLKKDDYVIDIGSYIREWAYEIVKRHGCTVECFDALDNRAAWLYDGEITTGGAFYYTSLFTPGSNKYRCEDICKYLTREVALMKINIEGGEYDLLNHIISTGKIGVIKNIQVQFHYIEGKDCDLMYRELAEKLNETHICQWRYPFVWESWRLR